MSVRGNFETLVYFKEGVREEKGQDCAVEGDAYFSWRCFLAVTGLQGNIFFTRMLDFQSVLGASMCSKSRVKLYCIALHCIVLCFIIWVELDLR